MDFVNGCKLQGKALFFCSSTMYHYMEMHELLSLMSLIENRFDSHVNDEYDSDEASGLTKNPHQMWQTQENNELFRRKKNLYNFEKRANEGARPTKDSLTKIYLNWRKNVHGKS